MNDLQYDRVMLTDFCNTWQTFREASKQNLQDWRTPRGKESWDKLQAAQKAMQKQLDDFQDSFNRWKG